MESKKQILENLTEQYGKLEKEYGKHLFSEVKTDISDFDLMKMGNELFLLLDQIKKLKLEIGAETEIKKYKNRSLTTGQRVKIYFNFHTKQFSIKNMEGLVVGHGDNIHLKNVEYKVSQTGREKVLRDGVKNVHAYVIGVFLGCGEPHPDILFQAYYNPLKVKNFVDKDTLEELEASNYAYLINKEIFYI